MQTISIPPSRHNINNLVVHSCTSSHKLALIRHHEEIEVNRSLKQKRDRKSTVDLRNLHPKVALRGKSKTQQREGSFSHCSVTNSGIRRRNRILSKQLSDQLEIRHNSPPFSPTK
uniref:Uncharacterized protein n=1 Tax=Manihot esculenta TaxID=3983 RepID=A0A2C9US37_MANES